MEDFKHVAPTLRSGFGPPTEAMLICPNCRHDYLHQAPSSEEEEGSLVIPFWCEGCTAIMALEFYQHKGNTFTRWWVGPEIPEKLREALEPSTARADSESRNSDTR